MKVIFSLTIAVVLLSLNTSGQKTPLSKKASDPEIDKIVAANMKLMEVAIAPDKKASGIGSKEGPVTGATFNWPPCIKIVDRPNHPDDADPKKLLGNINTFFVDISFVNKCSDPVTITFPPGLVLTTSSEGFQKGLLIEKVLLTVPPSKPTGGKNNEDTTTIYLGVACLNEHLEIPFSAIPQEDGSVLQCPMLKGAYRIDKITDHKGLQQLLAVLANKPKLRLGKDDSPFKPQNPDEEEPVTEKMNMYDDIQKAIWQITDGRGITRGELDKLKSKLKAFE